MNSRSPWRRIDISENKDGTYFLMYRYGDIHKHWVSLIAQELKDKVKELLDA